MTRHVNGAGRIRHDLMPTLDAYFDLIGVHLSGRGPWRVARCPFHVGRGRTLHVHVATQMFRCEVCPMKGTGVLRFHAAWINGSIHDAARDLGALEAEPRRLSRCEVARSTTDSDEPTAGGTR